MKNCYLCNYPIYHYDCKGGEIVGGEPALCDGCDEKEKSIIDERILEGLKRLVKEVNELNKRVIKLEELAG